MVYARNLSFGKRLIAGAHIKKMPTDQGESVGIFTSGNSGEKVDGRAVGKGDDMRREPRMLGFA